MTLEATGYRSQARDIKDKLIDGHLSEEDIKGLNEDLDGLKKENNLVTLEKSKYLLKDITDNVLINGIQLKGKKGVESFINFNNKINGTQLNIDTYELSEDKYYTIKNNDGEIKIYEGEYLAFSRDHKWYNPLDSDTTDITIDNGDFDSKQYEIDFSKIEKDEINETKLINEIKSHIKKIKNILVSEQIGLKETSYGNYLYMGHKIAYSNIFKYLGLNDLENKNTIKGLKTNAIKIQNISNRLNNSDYIKQFHEHFLKPIEVIEEKSKKEIGKLLNIKGEITMEIFKEKIYEINDKFEKILKNNYKIINFYSDRDGAEIDFNNTNDTKYNKFYIFEKKQNINIDKLKKIDQYDLDNSPFDELNNIPSANIEELIEIYDTSNFSDILKFELIGSNNSESARLKYKIMTLISYNNFDEVKNIIDKSIIESKLKIESKIKNKKIMTYLDSLNGYDLGFPNIKLFTISYDNKLFIQKDGGKNTYFTIPKYSNGKVSNKENLKYCDPSKSKEENNKQIIKLLKKQK